MSSDYEKFDALILWHQTCYTGWIYRVLFALGMEDTIVTKRLVPCVSEYDTNGVAMEEGKIKIGYCTWYPIRSISFEANFSGRWSQNAIHQCVLPHSCLRSRGHCLHI